MMILCKLSNFENVLRFVLFLNIILVYVLYAPGAVLSKTLCNHQLVLFYSIVDNFFINIYFLSCSIIKKWVLKPPIIIVGISISPSSHLYNALWNEFVSLS